MRSAIVSDGIVTNVILGQIEGSVPCEETVGIGWSWDGAKFAAPPAPEPEPVDPAAALAEWRESAELSKADFVLGLILLEILTIDDAISASRGNWPTALAGFLDYLTPEQSAQVQIEWATRTMIGRTDTYVLVLGSYLGLSDAQLDTLFGGDA